MEHLLHTPLDGERIDAIAYKYYGDPHLFEPILQANPHLYGKLEAAAGPPLKIPMIDPPAHPQQPGLPPWRSA